MITLETFSGLVEKLRTAHARIDELLLEISKRDKRKPFKELRTVSLEAKRLEAEVDKSIVQIRMQTRIPPVPPPDRIRQDFFTPNTPPPNR